MNIADAIVASFFRRHWREQTWGRRFWLQGRRIEVKSKHGLRWRLDPCEYVDGFVPRHGCYGQDTPHELSIVEAERRHAGVRHVRRAVGHPHHLALGALDRGDVDRFFAEVLRPLAERGLCTIEDPLCECPEYGVGYYATFSRDPDGLKHDFVVNPAHRRR